MKYKPEAEQGPPYFIYINLEFHKKAIRGNKYVNFLPVEHIIGFSDRSETEGEESKEASCVDELQKRVFDRHPPASSLNANLFSPQNHFHK